jgi:DNA-nicking Smr family endonuclease
MTERRERRLSDEENALWRGVAKSIKPLRAKPLKRADKIVASQPPGKFSKPKHVERLTVVAPPRPSPKSPPPAPVTLDRRTKQKLARGREAIDARIDLHGMTQAEAYNALQRFLHRVQADGAKFVIVVTGKGARNSAGERGVLRRQVPLWLSLPEFRVMVVGFEEAHIGHGGEGVLYVRVRRGR